MGVGGGEGRGGEGRGGINRNLMISVREEGATIICTEAVLSCNFPIKHFIF